MCIPRPACSQQHLWPPCLLLPLLQMPFTDQRNFLHSRCLLSRSPACRCTVLLSGNLFIYFCYIETVSWPPTCALRRDKLCVKCQSGNPILPLANFCWQCKGFSLGQRGVSFANQRRLLSLSLCGGGGGIFSSSPASQPFCNSRPW